jgi:hypothetical protein
MAAAIFAPQLNTSENAIKKRSDMAIDAKLVATIEHEAALQDSTTNELSWRSTLQRKIPFRARTQTKRGPERRMKRRTITIRFTYAKRSFQWRDGEHQM